MTDILRDAQPAVAIDKPPIEIRAAARAMAAGTASEGQQRRLWQFIIYELCGINQLTQALAAEGSIQNWRAGRRYPGLYLELARQMPVEDAPPPLPPARTMTERAGRSRQKIA